MTDAVRVRGARLRSARRVQTGDRYAPSRTCRGVALEHFCVFALAMPSITFCIVVIDSIWIGILIR